MSETDGLTIFGDAPSTAPESFRRLVMRAATIYGFPIIVAVIFFVVCWQRIELARTASLRCDELPLLMNSTGLCGRAFSEVEACAFTPSVYTFRQGLIRSLRPPTAPASVQTSAAFGAHVGMHLLGFSALAVRLWPLTWSMIALVAVMWCIRQAGGGRIAVMTGLLMLGLSPLFNVYAAQVRGYSESVCSAALLMAGVSYVRRIPRSWGAWLLVGWAFIQSAVSVYTTWFYWGWSVLVAAWLGASGIAPASVRRAYLAALAWTTVAVLLWIGLYTVDRFDALSGQATSMGRPVDRFADAETFVHDFMHGVLGPVGWLLVLAPVGMIMTWRGPCRWWLAAAGLCMACIVGVATVFGSPGYPRNFLFLLAPLSVFTALGAEKSLRVVVSAVWPSGRDIDSCRGVVRRGLRRWVMPPVVVGFMLFGSGWAFISLAQAGQRARLFLPDWGRAVARVNAQATDPCWMLRCEAFHRVIDWYGASGNEAVAAALNGHSFRVVLASQRDEHGRACVFRSDMRQGLIREEVIPPYLARCAPAEVVDGIELRAWRAMAVDRNTADSDDDEPVLLVTRLRESSGPLWRRMCEEAQADELGIVPFTPHVLADGTRVWPLLVPRKAVRRLASLLDISRAEGVMGSSLFMLTR